ncbi:MAG: alpha/beta fold hydrolase [Rhodococcus sp. (in: high G+C Gram-positive bacteria)]
MDWNDGRRKARLAETRLGHDWIVLGGLRRGALRVGLGLLPLLIVASLYWRWDVHPEQRRLADTQPQVNQIYDAADPENSSTAVVDLVGLGNVDAAPTARTLTSFTAVGRVWSVRYDNRGLDTRVLSELIAARARAANVNNVVLVGHSMGGVVALEVAQHIFQDSDRRLAGVVLDCTPLDLHAVRDESRDAGEELLRWIGWLPGARESRTLRAVVEMAARKDRFLDLESTWYPRIDLAAAQAAWRQVMIDKILNPSAASNGFIESQFRTIVASGALDNLGALSSSVDDQPRPTIVLMRPRYASADHVVDNDYSQRILFDSVGGPDSTLRVVRMDGTGHANPRQASGVYNAAIEARVIPVLESSIVREQRSEVALDRVVRQPISPR